jgi:hypothetical protein
MIFESLFFLARLLLTRSNASKEPEDAIYAAKYLLRHPRDPGHTPFAFRPKSVTAFLVEALAFQMEMKASDVAQTLEEMAVLTHDILTSDPSNDNTTLATTLFADALLPTIKVPAQSLDQS